MERGIIRLLRRTAGNVVGRLPPIFLLACGGTVDPMASDVDDASRPPASEKGLGAIVCSTIPESDLPSGAAPVSGTVVGPSLGASVCPNGAEARLQASGGGAYPKAPFY